MLPADQNIQDTNTSKVSVLIVTYNASETLQACLNSIYRQKFPSIEIVVIDGKSTDGTVKILEENSNHIHYWKSEPDNGIYDAMNKAIKQATGNWIYFLGADDVLFDEFTNLAHELKENDTVYYGRVLTLGGPTIPVNAYSFAKYGICHQAMIYPKAVFEKNIFNTKYKISADYALNMSLFNSKAVHFTFKNHLIAKFNHTGVSSVSIDKAFEKDRAGLVFKYFGLKIWLRFLFWRLKRNSKPGNASA
jgi:glycosyltransferase involved in cell wall biosynthesis